MASGNVEAIRDWAKANFYTKDEIDDSFINGSPVTELQIEKFNPIMTSDTTPSGICMVLGYTPYGGTQAWQAFNGDETDGVYGPSSGVSATAGYSRNNGKYFIPLDVDILFANSGTTIEVRGYQVTNPGSSTAYDLIDSFKATVNSRARYKLKQSTLIGYPMIMIVITGGVSTNTPLLKIADIYGVEVDTASEYENYSFYKSIYENNGEYLTFAESSN